MIVYQRGDWKISDDFSDRRDKIHPEPRKISIYVAITITISISIPLSVLAFCLGRVTAPQATLLQPTPTTIIKEQLTTPVTVTPVSTQATPFVSELNQQLICQNCQDPNVTAVLKSYSIDPPGYTNFTVSFINHTSIALNMKVDTIKLIDQSGTPFPLYSNDPYVPVVVGQTVPITVVFQFVPQHGSKYTFTIVTEQADKFANFYQSAPLTLSQ